MEFKLSKQPVHIKIDGIQPQKSAPTGLSENPTLRFANIEAKQIEANGQFLPFGFQQHPFFQAAYLAYKEHYGLVLTPDIIWVTILNGLAQHIKANAEKLRSKFVAYPGKLRVEVRRDEFVKGSDKNDWQGVASELADIVGSYIGKETHDMIVPSFSTSTKVSKASFEIALLDSMQEYFEYHCYTLCGIPEFIIHGSEEDWKLIKTNINLFLKIDPELNWWIEPLSAVIDEFIAAAQHKPDTGFWRQFVKNLGGSGGPYVSGAILCFFPYITSGVNGFLKNWKKGMYNTESGLNDNQFQYYVNKAPLIWHYMATEYEMEFISGFMGITYNKADNSLRPELGWVFRQK